MYCKHPINNSTFPAQSRLLAGLVLSLLLAGPAQAVPVQQLDAVGAATLKVFLWTIYDSRLYSEDGNFDGIEPNVALEITYRRNIDSQDLVQRTRKEWRKLSLYQPRHEQWLDELRSMWPDVKDGDTLLLVVEKNLASQFYLNGNPIGRMEDSDFTRSFLSIWLSKDSSYPALRDQLLGLDAQAQQPSN